MGNTGQSGKSGQRGGLTSTGENAPKPKRNTVSAIKYARELNQNDNTKHIARLSTELKKDLTTFKTTKKNVSYRLIYENGNESIITFKSGKYFVVNPDKPGERLKNLKLGGIKYISKASKNKFQDSLGFSTGKGNEKAEKIFSKEKSFNTYTKEVTKLFRKKKSSAKKVSKKK